MTTAQATITKTKWGIDPAHTEIGFKAKHLMIANVKGSFKEFDGSIYLITVFLQTPCSFSY